MRTIGIALLTAVFWLLAQTITLAQCAMCRATLETNVSNGDETVLAAKLNIGILYLFAAPYLVVAAIAYLWYKNSRKAQSAG